MIIPTTKCDNCEKTAVEMYTEETAYGTYWSTYECDCGGVTERGYDVSTFMNIVNRTGR